MKSLEQIAQEVSDKYRDKIPGVWSHPILREALQELTQQHEAQVASLIKERDDAREDVKRLIRALHKIVGYTTPTGNRGGSIVNDIARAAITQAMTGGAE